MTQHATETAVFDESTANTFAERIGDIINNAAIAVMLSIGHRSRLLDTLADESRTTSDALAARSGLAERYVREWLAVMVVAGIVDYDATTREYRLPAEHAACLTRGGTLGNLAVYAQTIPLMGAVQERILACFATGEGLRYDDYPCFHQFMAEDSAQTVTARLFDTILPLAPGLTDRLQAGIDVLDAGCGRGEALMTMAAQFPNSRFVGLDLCRDAVEHATATAHNAGLENIRFAVRDLTHYDETQCFDLITSFDAVHDQRDPQDLLRRLHHALRPGGTYLMQDVGGSAELADNREFPMAALLYAVSCTHCMPVSLGQGGLGLGTMWGWETAEAMLTEAGFRDIQRRVFPHDPMNVWFVSRRD